MRYKVRDPQGNLHIIEGPDGATPDQVIAQAQQLIPQAQPQTQENPQSYLQQLQQSAMGGLMQKPGFEPPPGIGNEAAYLAGKYGPSAVGGTIGSLAMPGAGTVFGAALGPAMGAAVGAGAGAMAGRSLQNLGQVVSNQVQPGSAIQKTTTQLAAEPTTDALLQGLFAGGLAKAGQALKEPAIDYASGMTGVKKNLMSRAFQNISDVFGADSVKEAGENLGDMAAKAGIQTGTDGYKLATASMLGKDAATDEFSTGTTLAMARLARETGLDALDPQELYSLREGLSKAMAAPKYADPHGAFSQNFRMYAQQLADIDSRLEQVVPGYSDARDGYVKALAKEALGSLTPLNKNMSASQLKLMAATPQALAGAGGLIEGYRAGTGKAGPAELLLSASLLSPLMVGRGIQAASAIGSTQVPQTLGRAVLAGGTNALSDILGTAIGPPSGQNQ